MTDSGRTGSDDSPIEYTQRPANLATKAATEISASASDPFRGHCTRSGDLDRPRIIRRGTAKTGR
jgi:hypothetical protein